MPREFPWLGWTIECWRHWVLFFASRMPIDSPGLCAALSAVCLASGWCLLPNLGRFAASAPLIGDVLAGAEGARGLRMAQGIMEFGAYACAWMFQARCLQICHPEFYDRYAPATAGLLRARGGHGFAVAGMPVNLDDLRTSVLVTGVTGSSKTAGVLMPALAQLFGAYRDEAEGEFQKIGAFIPEVKGDLVDGCIYLAHEAGRCVSRDVIVISPSCRIPVVRYRDERGRRWFLSARGGAGGSDAGEWLPAPSAIFESPADFAAILPELAKLEQPLGGRRPRFIGWRWDGARLWRVSHTVSRAETAPLAGPGGGRQWTEPPEHLTVDGMILIDNGVHYNLVDPRLPAAEAAERLTRLAAMARGTSGRGDNDYFYDQGRKVIGACIALHRAVVTAPCTAADIVRLATQDQRLAAALAALAAKIKRLREETPEAEDGEGAAASRRLIGPLEDLGLFFRDEWQKMVADGKTANVIKSTISGAFDIFLQDPNLAETFCRPSTFSFEDAAQSGKIIGLVPGDRYEQLGRLMGTACKLDFQSAMLSRNGRSDLNAARLVLYFADECHKYVASGSAAAGDPSFMNLSRSNNVVNICATQSYAWLVEVIGREAANVYISAFGVQFWLQQTDPETCRRASEICGTVKREKITADHDFDFGGFMAALGKGRGLALRRRVSDEERERFRPEDFAHLDVGEIIAYNKGRPGRLAKVTKGRAAYHFCTEKPAGVAAVRARVREYYREVLENLAHERGEESRWDCEANAPVAAPIEVRNHSRASMDAAADGELTRAQIARDRTEFKAYIGSLDAAIEEAGGPETLGLAIGLEEARRRAEDGGHPAEEFGAALGLGAGGMSSEPGEMAVLAVPPGAPGLPYAGDLATLAGEQARQRLARERKGARCA